MSDMTETETATCAIPGKFSWNELATTDVAGATAFYTSLLGWTTAAFGPEYTLFKKGDHDIGGMMKAPQPGMPAQWVAYVTVEDVDATAAKAVELGGKVMAPPFDVPSIGRIAILLDPQGAPIGIFKPQA
jgi:predicted enzyme related to lactoylglutathione lyase